MENLESLEKAINSELTTKILSSKIKHDQINICIEDNNLIEVMIFLKTHSSTKFKQLIEDEDWDIPDDLDANSQYDIFFDIYRYVICRDKLSNKALPILFLYFFSYSKSFNFMMFIL